ncbi:sensor histidine kinase [Streptomyces sp. NPDC054784]
MTGGPARSGAARTAPVRTGPVVRAVLAVRTALARGSRRERAADALLWLVLCAPGVVEYVAGPPQEGPAPVPPYLTVPVLALAVLVCRTAPLLSLYLAVGLAFVASPELFSGAAVLPLLATGYLVGRRMRQAPPALVSFGMVAALGLLVTWRADEQLWSWFTLVLTLVFNVALPWLVGRYVRQHAELVATGWELAERMEREQQLAADRVRLRERSRIAGDMHDTLGHELSLLALRAGALEVAPDLDPRHREAAEGLRTAAVTATETLHDIIGVLRDGDAAGGGGQPDERLAGVDIADLVDRAAASGLPVELRREGEPVPLPPLAERALHRVVQESLTNAAKHAPGGAVTVELRQSPDATEVSVVSERPAGDPPPRGTSGGNGLIGLRERVRLSGGVMRDGPVALPDSPAGSGYEVRVRLPHEHAHGASGAVPTGAATATATLASATSPPAPAPSESSLRRELAERKERRRLRQVFLVPLALTSALAVAMTVFAFVQSNRSVLPAADYDRMRVGQDERDVFGLLPNMQTDEQPGPHVAPGPPGSRCRYYRMDDGPDPVRVYRLCFGGGRLVAKDAVRTGS